MPLSTLRPTPRDVARKTRGQDGFAVLLSCRALASPSRVEDWRGAFRFRRSVAPRFLMGVPQERHRGPGSNPRLIKPSVRISRTGLPGLLLAQAMRLIQHGSAFAGGATHDPIVIEYSECPVKPLTTPPLPAEARALPGTHQVSPDLLLNPVFDH